MLDKIVQIASGKNYNKPEGESKEFCLEYSLDSCVTFGNELIFRSRHRTSIKNRIVFDIRIF